MEGYFYGWYFKCQSDTQTLAIIPALHEIRGKRTYSIQIITEDGTWNNNYEENTNLLLQSNHFTDMRGQIEKNVFGKSGVRLLIDSPQLKVKGKLRFSNITPIKYDIMGPFSLVPYMECRHYVYSMQHRVDGKICINGKDYVFENALGYWEGDSGRSFPKEYAWTQCFLEKGSLMLAVADIPLAGMHFTGIIGIVLWKGKEYRFATYLGARVVQKCDNRLLIRQGNMELEARLLEHTALPLKAPLKGEMKRIIRESATCRAFYRFRISGVTMFSFETDKAAFEYEY